MKAVAIIALTGLAGVLFAEAVKGSRIIFINKTNMRFLACPHRGSGGCLYVGSAFFQY